jgi:hypothetical protein
MKGVNSETTTISAPDPSAIRARAAARGPEQSAARQARLDARAVGLAAMALGDEYLARGELSTARGWFEIAAAHDALDARARLATVAVVIDAMNDPGLVESVVGTDLAGDTEELDGEREATVEYMTEAAEVIRAARTRAERIVAAATRRAEAIIADAHAEAAAVQAPVDHDEVDQHQVWVPGGRGRSVLFDFQRHTAFDLILPVRLRPLVFGYPDETPAPAGSQWEQLLREWVLHKYRRTDDDMQRHWEHPRRVRRDQVRSGFWCSSALLSDLPVDHVMRSAERLSKWSRRDGLGEPGVYSSTCARLTQDLSAWHTGSVFRILITRRDDGSGRPQGAWWADTSADAEHDWAAADQQTSIGS